MVTLPEKNGGATNVLYNNRMEWSIEEIEQNLLHGKITDIALPSGKIVGAVSRVGDVLGTEWIRSESSAKGLSPAMRIIGMGLRLTSLDGVGGIRGTHRTNSP